MAGFTTSSFDTGHVHARLLDAITDGLVEAAGDILDASDRDTPVDTGQLERSGKTSVDRAQHAASVYYDDEIAPLIHEKTGMHHPNGGHAKFLERAAMSRGDLALSLAAVHAGRALRGR